MIAHSSSEARAKMSIASKGLYFITNGLENRRIAEGVEMPDGWRKGRVYHK